MTRLLFWNTHQKAAERVIAQVAAGKQADILALAEASHVNKDTMVRELLLQSGRTYHQAEGAFRIRVYSALPRNYLRVLSEPIGMVFIEVRQVFAPSVLVAFVHLTSKMGLSTASVDMLSARIRPEIEKMEAKVKHGRTIIMGDLNMEPYDIGVVSSESFHATMCARIARRRERRVQGQPRFYFYNPMWNLLGDQTKGPPGTFYRSKGDPNAVFWHMIDQVLLRPDMIDLVDIASLDIVTDTGKINLTTNDGRPNLEYSDHFPIYISTRERPSIGGTHG